MKTTIGAVIAIVVIILIVVLTRSGHQPANTNTPSDTSTPPVTTPQNTTTPPVSEAPTTFQITTTTQGTGPEAAVGNTVSMNYTGTLTDGTVFDSNILPKFGHVQPFQFTLGQNMVIQGWEKGVLGMKKGEKRHLVIPASLGYGASGQGPIPPNATLVFDVELVSIDK